MSCTGCKYYSELKQPRSQRHRDGFVYTVRGYCFCGSSRAGYNMGTAVLIPEASCARFDRSEEGEDEQL